MSKVKRLFFDIETSPNIGFFWKSGYKLNIGYENIIKERAIICIAYKWADSKDTFCLTWDEYQNDKKLLEAFIKIANQADELIGHNGDSFDLPWIRTRCLFHKISMFPTYSTLDTLKNARFSFNFNSNRLDYIAKYLGIGAKIKTDFDLWKNIVLKNDKKALEKMVHYCKGDVKILEQVYNEMSPYIPPRVHHGVLAGYDKSSCPECRSEDVRFIQNRATAMGTIRVQLRCNSCGKYHTVSETTYNKLLKLTHS